MAGAIGDEPWNNLRAPATVFDAGIAAYPLEPPISFALLSASLLLNLTIIAVCLRIRRRVMARLGSSSSARTATLCMACAAALFDAFELANLAADVGQGRMAGGATGCIVNAFFSTLFFSAYTRNWAEEKGNGGEGELG